MSCMLSIQEYIKEFFLSAKEQFKPLNKFILPNTNLRDYCIKLNIFLLNKKKIIITIIAIM
jgi:hypothetical protein